METGLVIHMIQDIENTPEKLMVRKVENIIYQVLQTAGPAMKNPKLRPAPFLIQREGSLEDNLSEGTGSYTEDGRQVVPYGCNYPSKRCQKSDLFSAWRTIQIK